MARRIRLRPLSAALLAWALALASLGARPAWASPHDVMERAWQALKQDAVRRLDRRAWVDLVDGFEGRSAELRGAEAAQAYWVAARAAYDMAELTGLRGDFARAETLYEASRAADPGGPLADDALVASARLAQRLGNNDRARRCLERAVTLRGDQCEVARSLLRETSGTVNRSPVVSASPTTIAAWVGPATTFASSILAAPSARHEKPSAASHRPETTRASSTSTTTSHVSATDASSSFASTTRALTTDVSTTTKEVRSIELVAEVPPLPSSAEVDNAEAELTATAELFRQLKETSTRESPQRESWLTLIARLEATASLLGSAAGGPTALLRAGRAAGHLAGLSGRTDDVRRAVGLYASVAARCAGSSLVDDALVSAADLESRKLNDKASAVRRLEQAAALQGDMQVIARELLGRLQPPASTVTVKVEREVPIARQTTGDELRVRRIVIDAGHGGHDTGAIGPTGVREKDVTLAVARALAAQLRKRGYEVRLTRSDDRFLSLPERTRLANEAEADLFLSVHANAHNDRSVAGVETFSLNVASDRYASRLATRENASMGKAAADLPFLLADLSTRANSVDSTRLAREVQRSIVNGVAEEHGRPRDHGVKHALFYVLLGARMPAVLVETAFLSNPAEERKLASAAFQQTMARSIAEGVDRFVDRRTRVAALSRID